MGAIALFLLGLAVATALPPLKYDPVIHKDSDLRYQYMRGPDGTPLLVDTWVKASDLAKAARFDPLQDNEYHLFTRQNPSVSQPLLFGNLGILNLSNFNPQRRTIVLIHGWFSNIIGDFNTVLIPAFLAGEDVNVLAVDWSYGGNTIDYPLAMANTVISGIGVANFINWLNSVTGASLSQYHIVGYSLGAHKAGITGRTLNGQVPYVTGLDPASPGWDTNPERFSSAAGVYTEVIHTNVGQLGYLDPLGDADFYPNGGVNMPGCNSAGCDHDRAFYYLAESVVTGGFTGNVCPTLQAALLGQCNLGGTLPMGGLTPKPGATGIFYVETNAAPPFSRG